MLLRETVSLKIVSRNRKPPALFHSRKTSLASEQLQRIFIFPKFPFCFGIGEQGKAEKLAMRKEKWTHWRISAKFCLPFSYFPHQHRAKRHWAFHYLEIENERTYAIGNDFPFIFNAKFSLSYTSWREEVFLSNVHASLSRVCTSTKPVTNTNNDC